MVRASKALFVPLDYERLEKTAQLLIRATEVEAIYTQADPHWAGRPGSMAERERSHQGPRPTEFCWRPRSLQTTYAVVHLHLLADVEHARSIARLLTMPPPGPEPLGAPLLARSAVEIASRAWWLADPRISTQQRVARYLADELFSAYEAETLAADWGLANGVMGLAPTVGKIKDQCRQLGLPADSNKRRPTVAGERRPTSTDLVGRFLADTLYPEPSRAVYRLYSAMGHGTHYGLLQTYRDAGTMVNGEKMLDRGTDQRTIEAAAGITMASFIAALRRIVALMGWGWTLVDMYELRVHRFLASAPAWWWEPME